MKSSFHEGISKAWIDKISKFDRNISMVFTIYQRQSSDSVLLTFLAGQFFVVENHPAQCRIFSSIVDLHLLEDGSTNHQHSPFFFFNILSRFVIAFLLRSKHLLISWLRLLYAVILEPRKIKSVTVSSVSLSICHEVMGPDAMIFAFWMLSFNPTFSLSFFTFIKRLFSSSLLFTIIVVSSAYLRLLIFLPAVLIPAWASSSPAFLTMHSEYKLNKQGNNIQPWRTPFPNLTQCVVPCSVQTVASWPAYRFHRRQVRWSIFHFLEEFSTVCCYPHSQRLYESVVNESEVNAFLEFSCFCYDPADVGN